MSRCRTIVFGLLATLLYANVSCSQYSANMFLNGDYQNGIRSQPDTHYSVNPASNIFLEHAIISRQAQPFQGPLYLPPTVKCSNGKQCVRKSECLNGYTEKLSKIENCNSESDICCSYRPPTTTPRPTTPRPTTPRPTTTTQRPYTTCDRDFDCVPPSYCVGGEIPSEKYEKKTTSNRCYAPEVCCRMPSTYVTKDGYVIKKPENQFHTPIVDNHIPASSNEDRVTVPNNQYLPPTSPRPTAPPATPAPYTPPRATPPRPTPPRATPAPYTPPRATPPRPTQPRPTQPRGTPPTYTKATPNNEYLPPVTTPVRASPAPYRPQPTPYRPQPTVYRPQPQPTPAPYRPTQVNTAYLPPKERVPESTNVHTVQTQPIRGEGLLSPQIFPNVKTNQVLPKHFAKCASALVCTRENFCNSIGVISETAVELSPAEYAFRVPLTDCQIPETGEDGKCCRDPNYVDPWPVNLAGVCASRNKNTKPQGIKDIDSNFAEIPWQAMILKESSKSLLCGGAIIGDEFVLTTAACVNGLALQDCRIKAGEWKLGSNEEPLDFQLVGAKSITPHPGYNAATGENDMAIIRLEKRLEFATHIQPICISDVDPTPNEKCVTTGWGKQALQIHEEGALMHVTTTSVKSRSDCGADGSSVCSSTKFDSCEFDNGSALACGSGSSVLLKGIFSAENGCGEGQTVRFSKPDVKWINTAFAERNKPLLLKRF